MAKRPSIRISNNDKEEYAKLARKSRTKVRRLQKEFGVDLEKEFKIPKLGEFKSRKEFNEWKDKQEDFTNPYNIEYKFQKNQYGVVKSRKEIRDVERATRLAQRIAKDQVNATKNLPFYVDGKQQGKVEELSLALKKGTYTQVHVPEDFNFEDVRSDARFDSVKSSMENRANRDFFDKRQERMQNNFQGLLEDAFNSDADDLVKEIGKIPPADFYALFLMFPEVFDFKIYYKKGDGDNDQVEQMTSYVKNYHEGKYDDEMDLKGF